MIIAVEYLDQYEELLTSNIVKGSPGIGGTEYLFILLAAMLRDSGIRVVGLSEIKKAECIILRARQKTTNYNQSILDENKRKIFWCHNHLSAMALQFISQIPHAEIVMIGDYQVARVWKSLSNFKSTQISNPAPSLRRSDQPSRDADTREFLCFVGALIPQKGLAEAIDIFKRSKLLDTHDLYVLGSSDLYQSGEPSETKKDPITLMERSYFDQIQKNIDLYAYPQIKFYGRTEGKFKHTIIRQSSGLILNPTGNTEVQPTTALEAASLGVPVFTISRGGNIDVVKHRTTGVLYRTTNQMVRQLRKDVLTAWVPEHISYSILEDHSLEGFLSQWLRLLSDIVDGVPRRRTRTIKEIIFRIGFAK
jgi:glycosyltransferase involved in cell wall biosynthesis